MKKINFSGVILHGPDESFRHQQWVGEQPSSPSLRMLIIIVISLILQLPRNRPNVSHLIKTYNVYPITNCSQCPVITASQTFYLPIRILPEPGNRMTNSSSTLLLAPSQTMRLFLTRSRRSLARPIIQSLIAYYKSGRNTIPPFMC